MDDAPSDLSFSFARFADGFDSHIRKSIRGYNELLEDCVAFSEYFIDNDTSMFDIGCSTGSFLMHIWERNFRRAPQARYVGIDVEDSFAAQWEAYGAAGIEFKVADIRSFSIPDRCSLVTSLFSIQFIAERERQKIIEQIYRGLVPGGAFLVAEKTVSQCAKLHEILTFVHYDYKRRHFSDEEILEKERSLRSLLKPWTEERLINALVTAGFEARHVQPFWRNHSFAAFVALR